MVVRRPVTWAIGLISIMYYGIMLYWQQDNLMGDDVAPMLRDRAILGLGLSILYVGFLMWTFMKDLPEGLQEVPIIGKYGKMLIWLGFVVFVSWYSWFVDKEAVGYLFVGVLLMGFGVAAALTCLFYTGTESSRLYALRRFVDVYPTITKPDGHVRFMQKLWTTTFVLILYFAMTNVMIWGLSGQALDIFSGFRAIMAGASGTIMHLGIGPIVTGSIIMQLFAGAKIIKLDLQDTDDKALYQGVP